MEIRIQAPSKVSKGSFEVALFCPEDADGVARLFRSVHGENYPIKMFYDAVQPSFAEDRLTIRHQKSSEISVYWKKVSMLK